MQKKTCFSPAWPPFISSGYPRKNWAIWLFDCLQKTYPSEVSLKNVAQRGPYDSPVTYIYKRYQFKLRHSKAICYQVTCNSILSLRLCMVRRVGGYWHGPPPVVIIPPPPSQPPNICLKTTPSPPFPPPNINALK